MLGLFLKVAWRGHDPAKDPDLLGQGLGNICVQGAIVLEAGDLVLVLDLLILVN